MPGYDHYFGGSSSSSNSPGHPGNQGSSQNNQGTGQSGGHGGGGGGGWSPHNVPDWRKPKDKPKPIVSNPPHQVIRDVKAEDEAKEVQHYQNWLGSTAHQGAGAGNVTWANILQDRKKSAYEASLENQQQMQQAIDLANKYKSNQTGEINIDNISDEDLNFMTKAGLFAAEASGDLGGTFGAEIEMNKLKYQLQYGNPNEQEAAWNALAKLNRDIGGWKATDMQGQMGLLNYDPTGMLSWSDVENDPNLKFAYYGLQNKNASADQIRQHLPNVWGYKGSGVGGWGSGGSGWGGGYGGGGGGYGGPGGFQYNRHAQQGIAQPPGVGPGTLQEQVNQGFLSGMGAPRFSRGGIVSLLRLGE